MRTIITATLCCLAFSATSAFAQGQKVEVIKARGANAAGVCAGSLDMLGQYMSRASNPDPNKISEVQTARNFFADMPRFPKPEITAAANAFVELMVKRIRNSTTIEERQAIQEEIVKVSRGCFRSAKEDLRIFRESAPAVAPAPQPVPTQPYTIQPLILDPIQPGTIQPQ